MMKALSGFLIEPLLFLSPPLPLHSITLYTKGIALVSICISDKTDKVCKNSLTLFVGVCPTKAVYQPAFGKPSFHGTMDRWKNYASVHMEGTPWR